MATTTTNLGLKKPALTDDALISDINDNMDDLDSVIGAVPSGTSLYTAITTLDGKILKTTGTYSGLTWKLSGVNNMTYLTISGTTTASIAQWAFFNIGITNAGHITMLVSGTPENTFQFNANGDIKFTRAISSGTTINAVFIISTDIALADILRPSGYTSPTNIHANATLVQGGYVQVGNMIVVNCRLTINTAIPATTTIAKFPGYTKTGISYSHVALANNKLIDLGIDQGGDLRSPVQVTTGTLVISGVYFALS